MLMQHRCILAPWSHHAHAAPTHTSALAPPHIAWLLLTWQVRGIVAHGRAGEACLIHADRTATKAKAEAAAAAAAANGHEALVCEEADVVECPSGCGCMLTWHKTHCCRVCAVRPGEHGPQCDRRLAHPPPKRYDVRRLVLLGCAHEDTDGVAIDAGHAFEHDWRMLSIHGTDDLVTDQVAARLFAAQHREHAARGAHRLRTLAHADHAFTAHRADVALLVNDWYEGVRRLTHADLGANAAVDDDSERMLVGGTHVVLSGTRAGSRMLGSSGAALVADELRTDRVRASPLHSPHASPLPSRTTTLATQHGTGHVPSLTSAPRATRWYRALCAASARSACTLSTSRATTSATRAPPHSPSLSRATRLSARSSSATTACSAQERARSPTRCVQARA
jgi:hypothetical protein